MQTLEFNYGNIPPGLTEPVSYTHLYAILFVAIKAIELLKVAFKGYET